MHFDDCDRDVLITGGAGFIGSNLAAHLLTTTRARVRVFDNLSRLHVHTNLAWLRTLPGASMRLEIVIGDVRDEARVRQAVDGCTEIYHLAAQVAVTTSVLDPLEDFGINALGTLNVLEAARRQAKKPFILFTSTNKVYGGLSSLKVVAKAGRYVAEDPDFNGVTEEMSLDFHSPYGCSKGAADQYVRDYSRIYGLPTVVFRMSCICGPRQFGTEDQGWVAHFLYSIQSAKEVTIYGDGRQVRDVLHVQDLIDAFDAVRSRQGLASGNVFNLGGGVSRSLSVNEMLVRIEETLGTRGSLTYREIRPGDQPLYISDTSKLQKMTGWAAKRSVTQMLHDIMSFGKAHPQVGVIREADGSAEGMVA